MRAHLPFALSTILDRAGYAVLLALLAHAHGVGEDSDIFFAVTTLPAVLMTVLNDAAFIIMLRSATDPAIDESQRWRLAGQHGVALALIFLVLGGLIILAADPLMRSLAPGLTGAAHDRATHLQRLTALLLPLQGIGTIFGTLLISHGRKWSGAMRLPLTSISAVLAVLLCLWLGNGDVEGFAASLVGGALVVAVGLGTQIPGLCREKRVLVWPGRRAASDVLITLAILGGSGMAANGVVLVERSIASGLGEGALSTISLARSFVPLLGSISTSVATGWFSLSLANGRDSRQAPDIARTGREMIALSLMIVVPLMALFFAHSSDVVSLLFERGRFTAADTATIQPLAVAFALASPLFAISIPLGRTLQMCKADRQLLIFAWGGFGLYVVLALSWTNGSDLGAMGLAAAYVVSMLAQSGAQMIYLVRRVGRSLLALPFLRLTLLMGMVGLALAASIWLMPHGMDTLGRMVVNGLLVLAVFVAGVWGLALSPDRKRT